MYIKIREENAVKEDLTNLGLILSALRLTSRNLAEMLNVHYSLVSKWLNRKRPLRQNTDYMKRIVDIILNIDTPNRYAVVRSLLLDVYPDADLSGRENIAVYLSSFLSTEAPTAADIDKWDMPDYSKISSRFKVDVYLKEAGRQSGLLRLIDSALTLSPNQELLLYGRESMGWQMDYPEFQKHWLQKHMEVLRKGNKLTILHTVDRPPEELLFSLMHWIPLHLTRRTEAYYLPDYTDSTLRTSITVLRGRAAIAGVSADGFDGEMASYYTTDPGAVKRMENCFFALRQNSVPLFISPEGEQATTMALDMSIRKYDSFVYSSLPLQYGLESTDYGRLLKENNIEGEDYARCMIFFEQDKSHLFSVLDTRQTQVFLLKEMLESGLSEGVYVSGFNWIAGRCLFIPPDLVRVALQGYCKTLEHYPDFSVALLDSPPLPHMPQVNLIVKENTAVLANAIWPEVPGPLFIREPTIVMAFYRYFEKILRSIPKISRNKQYTVTRLQELANTPPSPRRAAGPGE